MPDTAPHPLRMHPQVLDLPIVLAGPESTEADDDSVNYGGPYSLLPDQVSRDGQLRVPHSEHRGFVTPVRLGRPGDGCEASLQLDRLMRTTYPEGWRVSSSTLNWTIRRIRSAGNG
jgi:hypothetical protein